MRVTSHGHACLLVETADRRILLDPGTFATGLLGRYFAPHVTHHSHCDVCHPASRPSSSHIVPCVHLLPAPLRRFCGELNEWT